MPRLIRFDHQRLFLHMTGGPARRPQKAAIVSVDPARDNGITDAAYPEQI
jgi:hypothetical protein